MPDVDPKDAPQRRPRLQSALVWFGIASDPREDRDEPTPDAQGERGTEWTRILFAFGIPLWASDTVDGWWYAVFIALAAPAGLIEFVRWVTRSRDRGWLDTAAMLLQFWPMSALLVFLFVGDDVGGGLALVYGAAASIVLFALLWAVIVWLARGAEPKAESH